DVDVEIGRLAVDQEVVQRLQAAQLVRAPRDRPSSQDERNPRVALARCEVALVDDRETHGSLTPPGASAGQMVCGALRHPGIALRQWACHCLPLERAATKRFPFGSTTETVERQQNPLSAILSRCGWSSPQVAGGPDRK